MIKSILTPKTGPMTDADYKTVMMLTTNYIVQNKICEKERTTRGEMIDTAVMIYGLMKRVCKVENQGEEVKS